MVFSIFQSSEQRSVEGGRSSVVDSMEASSDSESSDVMGDKKAAKPKKEKKSL